MNHIKAYNYASYSLLVAPRPNFFILHFYLHMGTQLPVGNKFSGVFMGTSLTVNETATYSSNTDFLSNFTYFSFDKFKEKYIKENHKHGNIVLLNESIETNQDSLIPHFVLAKNDFISKIKPQVKKEKVFFESLDNENLYTCHVNYTWLKKHLKEFETLLPKLILNNSKAMSYESIMAIKRQQFLNEELKDSNKKVIIKI